jgi:hypothetical protein
MKKILKLNQLDKASMKNIYGGDVVCTCRCTCVCTCYGGVMITPSADMISQSKSAGSTRNSTGGGTQKVGVGCTS